jgi:hypothetical protein
LKSSGIERISSSGFLKNFKELTRFHERTGHKQNQQFRVGYLTWFFRTLVKELKAGSMIFGNHWSRVRLGSLIFENRGVLNYIYPSLPPQVPQKENLPTMDGGFCSQGENLLAYEEDKTIYLQRMNLCMKEGSLFVCLFVCHIEISQITVLLVMLLIFLERPQLVKGTPS